MKAYRSQISPKSDIWQIFVTKWDGPDLRENTRIFFARYKWYHGCYEYMQCVWRCMIIKSMDSIAIEKWQIFVCVAVEEFLKFNMKVWYIYTIVIVRWPIFIWIAWKHFKFKMTMWYIPLQQKDNQLMFVCITVKAQV